MNKLEKYDIAYRMTSRASTGLSFVVDSLSKIMNNSTDQAYLRSFYILLSYNAELILKSRVVMKGIFHSKNEINKKLKALLHNIKEIGMDVGGVELLKLGINTIAKNGDKYILTTTDGKEIYIEDFADIRYDFINGKVRTIDNQEHERIKEYVEKLRLILQKVKEENLIDSGA